MGKALGRTAARRALACVRSFSIHDRRARRNKRERERERERDRERERESLADLNDMSKVKAREISEGETARDAVGIGSRTRRRGQWDSAVPRRDERLDSQCARSCGCRSFVRHALTTAAAF